MANPLARPIRAGVVYVSIGAVVFSLAAVYNGYPLVYPDSIPYVKGSNLAMRAPGYGWITAPLRPLKSVWPYVVFHCLIVAHLIYLTARTRTTSLPFWRFVLLLALLTAGTTLPWFTGFVMADIFSGVMILAFYLIVFRWRYLSWLEQCYLHLLFAAACIAHLSNPVVAVVLWCAVALLGLMRWLRTPRLRLYLVLAMAITAVALLFLNTRLTHGVWAPSAGGYAFPLARLATNGQLEDYLNSHCTEERYAICPYRNNLPETTGEFLWHDEAPFRQLGGFLGYRKEGTTLLLRTILDQPLRTAVESVDHAGQVSRRFHLRYVYSNQSDSWVQDAIGEEFPDEMDQFLSARQNTDRLNLRVLDRLHRMILFACVGVAAVLVATRLIDFLRPWHTTVDLIAVTAVALVIMCLSIGVFADAPSERYMARVIWLLPAAVFISVLFRERPEAA